MTKRDGTVYSSEHGRMCPHCGLPMKRCVCRANPRGIAPDRPAGDGSVRIRRETKGRGGKTVTTASGFALSDSELRALAKELRRMDTMEAARTEAQILGFLVRALGIKT